MDMNLGLMNQNMVQPYFPVHQSQQQSRQHHHHSHHHYMNENHGQDSLQSFNNSSHSFVYPSMLPQVPVKIGDNSLSNYYDHVSVSQSVMLDSPPFPPPSSYGNQFNTGHSHHLMNSSKPINATTNSNKRTHEMKQQGMNPNKKQRRRFGVKLCQIEGCEKLARSTTHFCAGHGGGRRCQKSGCTKAARGSTNYCIAHGGGRRCKFVNCTKSAQGSTYYCIAHGGGRRCKQQNCTKSARGPSGLCKAHGGGKKCRERSCTKLAIRDSMYCKNHALGGKRDMDLLIKCT